MSAAESLPSTLAKPDTVPELIDTKAVAAMLTVSVRHVERLAEAGRMPAGLTQVTHLGTIFRIFGRSIARKC